MVRAEPNLECRGEEPLNIKFEICEHDGEPTLVSGSAVAVFKKFGHPETHNQQEVGMAIAPTVDPYMFISNSGAGPSAESQGQEMRQWVPIHEAVPTPQLPISSHSELMNWDGRQSRMH